MTFQITQDDLDLITQVLLNPNKSQYIVAHGYSFKMITAEVTHSAGTLKHNFATKATRNAVDDANDLSVFVLSQSIALTNASRQLLDFIGTIIHLLLHTQVDYIGESAEKEIQISSYYINDWVYLHIKSSDEMQDLLLIQPEVVSKVVH